MNRSTPVGTKTVEPTSLFCVMGFTKFLSSLTLRGYFLTISQQQLIPTNGQHRLMHWKFKILDKQLQHSNFIYIYNVLVCTFLKFQQNVVRMETWHTFSLCRDSRDTFIVLPRCFPGSANVKRDMFHTYLLRNHLAMLLHLPSCSFTASVIELTSLQYSLKRQPQQQFNSTRSAKVTCLSLERPWRNLNQYMVVISLLERTDTARDTKWNDGNNNNN